VHFPKRLVDDFDVHTVSEEAGLGGGGKTGRGLQGLRFWVGEGKGKGKRERERERGSVIRG